MRTTIDINDEVARGRKAAGERQELNRHAYCGGIMRTTIDIDEELLDDARELGNGSSKKAIVEEALKEFIKRRRRERFLARLGNFEIDLTPEELRKMRGCD